VLEGRVVVIALADTDAGARAATDLAAAGANLVLCGEDAARLGVLASEVSEIQAVRVAIHVGAPDDPSLAELVAELFGT
jgi:NADP-dependent 3-hydroxy acid dehydrogenase YdfG